MTGTSDIGSLSLEISDDDGLTWNSIWIQTDNQGNSWQTINIDVSEYTNNSVMFRFNRVTGGTWRADIAIDAVSIKEGGIVMEPCLNGLTNYPYSEGFENSLGSWSQSSLDDIDWIVNSGQTASNNTGPSSAIEGSNYIYVEASGNGTGYPFKKAILTSTCFDLTGLSNANFVFNYHMFGDSDMGSISVEASNNNGVTWSQIWSESGNKGDVWLSESIDLSLYLNQSIQLRFVRITGGTWKADIAIDNINLNTDSPTFDTIEVVENNFDKTNIKLYPNPASNTLNIVSKTFKPSYYKIFNKFNQIIFEGSFAEQINVSRLKSGVYYLKLIDNDRVYVEQFIKK